MKFACFVFQWKFFCQKLACMEKLLHFHHAVRTSVHGRQHDQHAFSYCVFFKACFTGSIYKGNITCLKIGNLRVVAEKPQVAHALMSDGSSQESHSSCTASKDILNQVNRS